eukprot:6319890-Prymnesium_polylepis.1
MVCSMSPSNSSWYAARVSIKPRNAKLSHQLGVVREDEHRPCVKAKCRKHAPPCSLGATARQL